MPRKDLSPTTERVVFEGVPYRRYPNSDRPEMRRYFVASGGKRLHRAMWEHHNGPIPAGFHIHHVDGNTLNNDISNLECLSNREHRRTHLTPEASQKQRERVAAIRHLAKDWHRSPEGREWHREHAKDVWGNRLPIVRECFVCYTRFESIVYRANDIYCSQSCKEKARHARTSAARIDTRTCACGKEFKVYKHHATKSCSKSCGAKQRRQRERDARTPE